MNSGWSEHENRDRRKMSSLPLSEMVVYCVLWGYALARATYTAYRSALDMKPMMYNQLFEPGWSFIGKERDVADYEWAVWSAKYITLIPWVITHIILSQLVFWKAPKWLPYFYTGISMLCLFHVLGGYSILFLLWQPVSMFGAQFFQKKLLCWAVGIFCLVAINIYPFSQILEYVVPMYTDEAYMLSVVFAWTNIRSLSYSLHRCDSPSRVSVAEDFVTFVGFCFYMPLLFTGPLMMFDEFEQQLHQNRPEWTAKRAGIIFINIIRYIVWYFINEAIIHYIFVSALFTHTHLVMQLSGFGMAGMAYAISQFFMTKYAVLYGLPGVIAQIESFRPPEKPKCISRIHLYSDMWRYFDRGLYAFLKRYIYIPFLGTNPSSMKKFIASALTFGFIYLWHGTAYYIFIWSLLNYIGIVAEVLGATVSNLPRVKQFEESHLSPQWSRRLKALIITPLLMMSSISNFYFLMHYEVATIIYQKLIVNASFSGLFITTIFMYCMCQICIEIKNWETRKCSRYKA